MKLKSLILTMLSIVFVMGAFAQTNNPVVFSKTHAPKKGYYAIGNNASKYNSTHTAVGNTQLAISKGFFAQSKYKKKRNDSSKLLAVTNRPAVYTKGYYARLKSKPSKGILAKNDQTDSALNTAP